MELYKKYSFFKAMRINALMIRFKYNSSELQNKRPATKPITGPVPTKELQQQ